MNELHLFAGAGGGILGGLLLGHRPICAVEIEPYARKILLQRQRDGHLPWFPIWDDVSSFDGKPWRGIAEIVCGGFPCQDISAANANGKGLDGKRSGLWSEMARIIREVRPRFVFVENSPMLVVRGLGVVLGDLAEMGYDVRWGVYGADDAGAPHQRKRIWILGYPAGERLPESNLDVWKHVAEPEEHPGTWNGRRMDQPGIVGVADGVANWVDRLKAAGNGQVPAVAALAWRILTGARVGSRVILPDND
jgi:DNA (cytosine-5)-methyltransferase 1